MPTVPRFNYEKACYCVPEGIETTDDQALALIKACLLGSLKTGFKPEFRAQFEPLADTVETQVRILNALLDDACDRFTKAYLATHDDEENMEQTAFEWTVQLRSAFAMAAISTDVLSLERNPNPLFGSFFMEQLGDQEPTADLVNQVVNTFLENFKVKEYFQEKGIAKELVARLIAIM